MKLLRNSLLLLSVLAAAGPSFVFGEENSDVLALTKDTFKSVVGEENLIMVEFYAPWCGHCQRLAPEYEQAATELKKSNLKLAKVDCTAEQDLCSEHGVQGFPTLKLFRKDGEIVEYSGPRKADGLVSFMKKQTLPPVSELTSEKLETFKDSDRVVVVGFFSDSDKSEQETFETLAKKLRNDFVFGSINDASSAEKYGVKPPAAVLFKKFDEGKNNFEGKFDAADLEKFIKTNSVPLLDEISPENYGSYIETGLPLAFLFVENEDSRKELTKALEPIAREFKGRINFIWVDSNKFGQAAESLNLKEKWPAFAIQNVSDSTKYPFDQEKAITTESIHDFVTRFSKGEIPPSIKSEPIPEKNDGPVTVVVAKEFEKIVYDQDKDVLVEFYAPWCGHCKRLEPTWSELGAKVRANPANSKIVVAKMDATANDLPANAGFEISGFPTIKLFKAGKAGKDKEIVDYNDNRSLESLAKFLKDNAVNKVEIEIEEKKEEKEDKEEEKAEEPKKEEKKATKEDEAVHDEL
ncbi:uncharacterized protein VTP21DRAFT_4347 [Calcarisporiella thermophila]|uniref:uncharacterized protein n=1 Tax=Calcarisporiella thermophila TaxID=911321 RepID=UPI00374210D2